MILHPGDIRSAWLEVDGLLDEEDAASVTSAVFSQLAELGYEIADGDGTVPNAISICPPKAIR